MKGSSVACDSSVLVPALHPGYPVHAECRRQLQRVNVLPAHVLLETYRVLTSVAAPSVLAPRAALAVLEALALPQVQLPAEQYIALVRTMAEGARAGAAIYDAQIAATAKHYGLTLLSRDRRAATTYDLMGIDYELI